MKSDPQIEGYQRLRPFEFGLLERLELVQAVDWETSTGRALTLHLRSAAAQNRGKRLRLAFDGVRGLRIGDLEGLIHFTLEIESIRERPLDGLAYQVVEREYNAFFFYCRDFTCTLEDAAT